VLLISTAVCARKQFKFLFAWLSIEHILFNNKKAYKFILKQNIFTPFIAVSFDLFSLISVGSEKKHF
jgi:hypothetical protein